MTTSNSDTIKFDKKVCETCELGMVCATGTAVQFTICTRCGRKYAVPIPKPVGMGKMEDVYRVDHCPMSDNIRRDHSCVQCVEEINQHKQRVNQSHAVQGAVAVTSSINWEARSLRRIAKRAKYVILD